MPALPLRLNFQLAPPSYATLRASNIEEVVGTLLQRICIYLVLRSPMDSHPFWGLKNTYAETCVCSFHSVAMAQPLLPTCEVLL